MEAVPKIPLISFELKVSPENTHFGPKLKQYITEVYREDPESYSNEIHQLEGLRSAAVRSSSDAAGISALIRYFCQLRAMQSRFPMSKGAPAACSFTWKDIYASTNCALTDVHFEMACILYNIGALHSELGASEPRNTPDSLKAACTHFQNAAWAFQYIRDQYQQPQGSDLSSDILKLLQEICLAQAQECVLDKSIQDTKKPSVVGAVATQVHFFYKNSLAILGPSAGTDNIHEIIGTRLYNYWHRYLSFKSSYIGSIVCLYQGINAEEQQKMGERVAFYQLSVDRLNEARKLAKHIEPTQITLEALTFTNDVVEGKRKAAKNENEFIYHEKVPEKDLLLDLKPVCLVKALPMNIDDPEVSGPDIFSRLVPMNAHELSSLYSEEKAKLIREITGLVEAKNLELAEFMTSLQLDQLYVLDGDQKPPQEIVDRCAAMNAKTEVIQTLSDSMNSLAEVISDVEQSLDEIKVLIQEETAKETEYQKMIGPRPPSIVQTELSREYHKYMETHGRTTESNQVLHKAMTLHIANLRLLAMPLDQLQHKIPNLDNIHGLDRDTMTEMMRVVEKAAGMQTQRDGLVQQLRDAVANDDITAVLLAGSSDTNEAIFDRELDKHTPLLNIIAQNLKAQEKIINKLTSLYASYGESRRLLSDVLRKRKEMISALVTSYDLHEELLGKSQKGLEFYKKLTHNVNQLLSRLRSTCQVQEEERQQLLSKQSHKAPSLAPAMVPKAPEPTQNLAGDKPKLKDFLPYMKNRGMPRAVTPQVAHVDPPAPETYYPETIYPTSVRPAPVGSEATDVSQMPLTDGMAAPAVMHNQYIPNAPNPYSSYEAPYNQSNTTPNLASTEYNYPTTSKGYEKLDQTNYTFPSAYTPSSLQMPQQINPSSYQTGTSTYGTNATDSHNASRYTSSQSDNPNTSQYNAYSDPYMQPQATVSNVGPTPSVNQNDLNTNFAQMYVSAPKPEPETFRQDFHNLQYPQTSTPGMTSYANPVPSSTPGMTPYGIPVPSSAPGMTPYGNPASSSTPGMTSFGNPAPSSTPNMGQYENPPTSSLPSLVPYGNPNPTPNMAPYSNLAPSPNAGMATYGNPAPSSTSGITPYSNPASISTPGMTPYGNPVASPGINLSAQSPTDYNSVSYNQYGQQNINTNVSNAHSVTDHQYQYPGTSSYTNPKQDYPVYTHADNSTYSTTGAIPSVSLANVEQPYFLNNDQGKPIDPLMLAQLDAIDKPIKSHVTGQALSSGLNYSPYSNVERLQHFNTQDPAPSVQNYSHSVAQNMQPQDSYSQQVQSQNILPQNVQPQNLNPDNMHPQINQVHNAQISNVQQQNHAQNSQAEVLQEIQSPYADSTANPSFGTQNNVNYVQTYQSHPGYSYNTGTGNYDYNYGSQNSYMNYGNVDQVNVQHSGVKDQSWAAHGVYTNAGVYNTLSSPSETPQNSSDQSKSQTYYNSPYGYQTNDVQAGNVDADSVPVSTNYGANMNQSTYMQSGQGQNTSVTFTNPSKQVSTRIENEKNVDHQEQDTIKSEHVSEKVEVESIPETNTATNSTKLEPEPTAFDLLSDIDFTVEVKPLLPEIKVPQISESAIKRPNIVPKNEPVKPVVKEEILERPAKRDLFSDPALLNNFTQEVKDLQRLVDNLTNKSGSGLTVLDSIWKTYQELQVKENTSRTKLIAAKHSKGVTDVVPYDDTRLILKTKPHAYINASYYKQLAPWCIPLVLASNPSENEYSIFWRAILENRISCIVCLLSEIEMQGSTYWPTAKGQTLEMPGVTVTLEEVTCTVHWTERKITIASGKTVSNVMHYQINVFPAKIVCSPLVLLADKVLTRTYDNRLSNQLVGACIQCSSGAGRSSVLALIIMVMCQVRAGQLKLCEMLNEGCMNLYKNRTNVLEETKFLVDAYRTALFYVQGVLCSGTILFNGEAVSVQTGASVLPPITPSTTTSITSIAINQKATQKFSRESFEEMKQSPGLKSGDMKDPLNFLDPLWSLKKK